MEVKRMENMNIATLKQVAETLERNGFEVRLEEKAVLVKVDDKIAICTIDEESNFLTISCELEKMGNYPDEKIPALLVSLLDANTRISPFAFATITGLDNPELEDKEEEWPIVLIDSMPLGDLHPEELRFTMNSLLTALVTARELL